MRSSSGGDFEARVGMARTRTRVCKGQPADRTDCLPPVTARDAGAARRGILDLPWHPMLFMASLVIGFWLDTVVSPHAAFRSLLIGVAGAATLTVLLAIALRSPERAGIAASGLIGLLYSKHLVESSPISRNGSRRGYSSCGRCSSLLRLP